MREFDREAPSPIQIPEDLEFNDSPAFFEDCAPSKTVEFVFEVLDYSNSAVCDIVSYFSGHLLHLPYDIKEACFGCDLSQCLVENIEGLS